MAPAPTRRSVARRSAADLGVTPARASRQSLASTAQSDPPKRRSINAKTAAASVESDSISSLLTSGDSNSDAGGYSTTPATSNVVTPAPSVTAQPSTANKTGRSRLFVELPARLDDLEEFKKPKGFGDKAFSRAKRARRTSSYVADDSDDDDEGFGAESSRDAILARRLQREEDEKAAAIITAPPPTARLPLRRSARTSSTIKDDDSEDEDYIQDVIRGLPSTAGGSKGKGKASAAAMPAVTKLKVSGGRFSALDNDEDDDDDEPMLSTRRRARVSAASGPKVTGAAAGLPIAPKRKVSSGRQIALIDDDDDEDDMPLSRSGPARKKAKIAKPTTDSEDELQGVSSELSSFDISEAEESDAAESSSDADSQAATDAAVRRAGRNRRNYTAPAVSNRTTNDRKRLEKHHPELLTMWRDLEQMPVLKAGMAQQPASISRQLKPFQLEGLAWMLAMEGTKWRGGLLGDEMGLGKTIQAVSLIMSDYPAKTPTLVLVPPVALMQWTAEIESYTDGTLKTLVYHGTNAKVKNMTVKELKKYDVILMSYNSLESVYRKQEKGFKRKEGLYKEKSAIHQIKYHRVILDEAHCIKTRTTMTAKATFALKVEYRWCLTGTPLQNRIGEFFSLIRFLNMSPFASYFCKQCPCSSLEWAMNGAGVCNHCNHAAMRHVSVFNQELLNPIQAHGNNGAGKVALQKLRLLTDRIMLRRLKKDYTNAMDLPVKEIYVDRQFFGEEENDFANSIMTTNQRKFNTYVAQGVLLNNYANIFGLIMQMRQVADHPDLILKKTSEGGQNVLVCCICDEPAEEAIRSRCKHDFCRACATSYLNSQEQPDCPQCHIPLSIDLEQPEMEQDEAMVKKSSIINRIKMENWTSSSKIELLVHELHKLRSDNASHKSIIFSQFTTMLQLIEWRLRRAGITTVMLDGSMTPAQRQASINHFMTNVDVECFLVSLKAGGVALNLTEASQVFIVDPWWNPAAEWQSADRCHRIGQTRPCKITRLCIEDSVESRMVLLQEKKTNMINSTINSDDAAMESLTPADLQFLFRGN